MPDLQHVRSRYVTLRTGVPAALYEPTTATDHAHVAFVFMHPDGNFIDHVGCGQLARRGYRVLGANSRFANLPGPTGGPYRYYEVLYDVAACVELLRALPGVERIVLAGHSGGAPLFAAYQNLAENGAAVLQSPSQFAQVPDDLDGVPAADALVLLDAHVGYGPQALLTLDPSIVDESRPSTYDPALDMFDPNNGFDPDGCTYDRNFVHEFTAGQARRMEKLVSYAQDRVVAIENGRGHYPDDEPMVVPGINFRIWSPDVSLFGRTRGRWPLLKADGTSPVQVVRSVRPPSGAQARQRGYEGTLVTSVRKFLATHAMRAMPDYAITDDGASGLDWSSSYTSTPENLSGVTVPLLSLVMSAHYFLALNEENFSHAASADKEMAMVEGAIHFMTPCVEVEWPPGSFGDTLARTFDYVDAWTAVRT